MLDAGTPLRADVADGPEETGGEAQGQAPDIAPDIAIVGMSCGFHGIRSLSDFWGSVTAGAVADGAALECPSAPHVLAAALQDARTGLPSDAAPAKLAVAASGLPAADAASALPRPDLAGAEMVESASSADALAAVIGRLRQLACDVGIVAGAHLPGGSGHRGSGAARPYTELPSKPGDSEATQGCAVLVLKRRSDAERDGNRIYALVAGFASRPDRLAALRAAYAGPGMDAASVGMIEGSGAATPAGDADEIAALHGVFGSAGFPEAALGAVSSVVGQAGQATAIAGIVKAALAIHHRALPPTPGAETPHRDLKAGRIYLHAKLRPWIAPTGSRRRAGVSMDGGPGSCGHAVLEQPAGERAQPWRSLTPWRSELIVVSAETREELRQEIRRVQRVAAGGMTGEGLAALAFTLATRFSGGHRFRLGAVTRDAAELAARLALVEQRLGNDATPAWSGFAATFFGSRKQPGKIGFLFPGVGFPGLAGGYADRLGELALHFPDILDWLDRAETVCSEDEVSYKLSFQLFPPPCCDMATLAEIEEELKWSQRASVGTMIANLATNSLVRALGVHADVMAGFSLGEWSALVAAGLIDMEAAAVTAQGQEESSALLEITDSYRGSWAMVSASVDEIEAVIQPLGDDVAVTIDVSPNQAFIGGEEAAVAVAINRLRAAGIWVSAIPSSPLMASFSAFHTKYAAPYREQLTKTLAALPMKPLQSDIYSSVTGRLFPRDPASIVRILGQNVTDAVRVRDTIRTMHKHGVRIFLQLGGGGRLLSTVEKNLALEPHVALSIDVEYLSGLEQLQYVLAQLLALGVPLNPLSLYEHRSPGLLDLDGPVAGPDRDKPDAGVCPAIATARSGGQALDPRSNAQPHQHADAVIADAALDGAPAAPGRGQVATWLAELFEIERRTDQVFADLLTSLVRAAPARLPAPAEDHDAHPPRPSPLLGKTVEAEPGRRLRCRLTLDLAVHRFLGQHVLMAAPGALKPLHDLLPALPFACAIEIMAQAAQALAPGQSVLDCHDIEAMSWIALEGAGPLPLSVVAERLTDSEVQVHITIEGKAKPAMRGRVSMGQRPPTPAPVAFRCETPSPLSAADYYGEGPLFQGPHFRAITALTALSEDAIAGEVVLRDPRDLFARDGGQSAPIFDPILIDSVAQMLGVPAWINDRRLLVPIRAKRVSRFGPLPPAGTRAQARISYRRLDERRVEGDFDITGPGGETLLRVEGWEELWVIWPKCLLERNHRPKEGSIGRCWEVGDASLSCRRVKRADLGDVDPAWIARHYLTAREWEHYARAPDVPWLLRRIAAKDCVRDWFRRHRGAVLHPLEVEMADLPGGAMLVMPGHGPAAVAVTTLAGEAVAVASTAGPIKLDIAGMAVRQGSLQDLALSRQEMERLPPGEPERTAWAHRARCAKEACAKSCGRGTEAMPRFVVERVRPEDGVIEIRNEVHDVLTQVATAIEGGHAMALTATRQLPAIAPALA